MAEVLPEEEQKNQGCLMPKRRTSATLTKGWILEEGRACFSPPVVGAAVRLTQDLGESTPSPPPSINRF
jgi:hypothetical protein